MEYQRIFQRTKRYRSMYLMLSKRNWNANKAVLFDLDGVLVDACDWHYEALNKALKEVSNTWINRDEHVSDFNGLSTLTKLKMLVDQGRVKEEDIPTISSLKQKYTIQTIEDNTTVDETKVMLCNKLKANGYKVACVTNCIRHTAELMLKACGVHEHMDLIVSNEDSLNNKPHPEPYIKAMVILGCLPENCTIIEDSPTGLEAARLSGASVVKVRNATEVIPEMIKL